MARKILILFAFIIAAFPFLGFTETTDTIITTTLALLIAITLLFSRRPKMVPNTQPDEAPKVVPSPFSPKMQDIQVSHDDIHQDHQIKATVSGINPNIIKHVEPEVPSSIPSPLPIMPKRRVPFAKIKTEDKEVINEKIEETQIIAEPLPTVRKQRKNSPRILLAYEDQVHPADVPSQTHRETSL